MALQVVAFNCIITLREFSSWKAGDNCDLLQRWVSCLRVQFPAFGVVLSDCIESTGTKHDLLMSLCQPLAAWLQERAYAVYSDLDKHPCDEGQPHPDEIQQPDWRVVSLRRDVYLQTDDLNDISDRPVLRTSPGAAQTSLPRHS